MDWIGCTRVERKHEQQINRSVDKGMNMQVKW